VWEVTVSLFIGAPAMRPGSLPCRQADVGITGR